MVFEFIYHVELLANLQPGPKNIFFSKQYN